MSTLNIPVAVEVQAAKKSLKLAMRELYHLHFKACLIYLETFYFWIYQIGLQRHELVRRKL
jgi:hypothetical protein